MALTLNLRTASLAFCRRTVSEEDVQGLLLSVLVVPIEPDDDVDVDDEMEHRLAILHMIMVGIEVLVVNMVINVSYSDCTVWDGF